MKITRISVLMALIGLLAVSPCSLLSGIQLSENNTNPSVDPQVQIQQAVAATMTAQAQVALYVQQTVSAAGAGAPQPINPLPTATGPQSAPNPSAPMVSVSIDTNCRTGPGTGYPIVGVLNVGESAEVVGRNTASENLIIKNPDGAGNCWLWDRYATVTGDTSGLANMQIPPTPIPTIILQLPAIFIPTPTQPIIAVIIPQPFVPILPNVTLTITNNSGIDIWYVYISPSTDSNWGSDQLGNNAIWVGNSYPFTIVPGTYDVKAEDSTHNVLGTFYNQTITSDVTLIVTP